MATDESAEILDSEFRASQDSDREKYTESINQ